MTTSKTVSGVLLALLALTISVVAYVRSASPTHSVVLNAQGVADELATLNDLVRTRYVVQEVVTLKSGRPGEVPELTMVQGTVIAGVNLAEVRPADVKLKGPIARIQLPAAAIVEATLDASQTRVWDPKISFWAAKAGLDPAFEAEVEQAGTQQIRAAALRSGILKSAGETAERAIRRVLTAAGYRKVSFEAQSGSAAKQR